MDREGGTSDGQRRAGFSLFSSLQFVKTLFHDKSIGLDIAQGIDLSIS